MGELANLAVGGGEDIDDFVIAAVSALEQDRSGPAFEQAPGLVTHGFSRLRFRFVVGDQQGRLGEVGGDEVGDGQQVGAHGVNGIGSRRRWPEVAIITGSTV